MKVKICTIIHTSESSGQQPKNDDEEKVQDIYHVVVEEVNEEEVFEEEVKEVPPLEDRGQATINNLKEALPHLKQCYAWGEVMLLACKSLNCVQLKKSEKNVSWVENPKGRLKQKLGHQKKKKVVHWVENSKGRLKQKLGQT